MQFNKIFAGICCMICTTGKTQEIKPASTDSLKNVSLSGLSFRSIGPAITSGRVVDIAVNPNNKAEYYVASGHGSLWKTSNNGISFKPVFDKQVSYAIGAVKIDPSNSNIVWVGTGENNNQNNVIYGDGVYKSEDGGKTWNNMGLKNSEQIGGIVIDPNNSNVVYVAAYGSLRNEGGERGIYKTNDGGKSWRRLLNVSAYTGFFEIHIDPKNANTLYAVAHQRMRNLYTGIRGGAESAIYRSMDSGANWHKVMKGVPPEDISRTGLPSEDLGRIGMAVSPVNSNILYAIVEAKEGAGFYKSTDKGASWTKQSSYVSSYPFYMNKIFCDPVNENRVYSMDVFNQVTDDAGKSWKPLGEKNKHVDNHTLYIDPENTNHLISGCDGGVYETWDAAQNWEFKANLPIAEIYKVTTDNAFPFYNVYAGTQDNSSFGGPSRTINVTGIANSDWFFTTGGDGFETQVDWKDENIIYAQSQNGGLVRFDKKSGEKTDIKPVELNDSGYRFDWSSPLLISKHNNKRLFFGANKLFRTNDQGNTWEEISPDLTRGVPKKMQRLMNRSWSMDELASRGSMAQLSAVEESPIDENILYAGSGDGLLYFSTNAGKSWTRSSPPPGLPEYARVSSIAASSHNKTVAYAACENFIGGNYKPFLYKTIDGGKTWESINGNLPAKGSSYAIAEDFVKPSLLFAGTQSGIFFSADGGGEWVQLKTGIPPSMVSDIELQKRENDLIVSTFGRGIYILDDYSPLRMLTKENLQKAATIFPIKDALMYVEARPFAYRGKGFQGESYFTAPNPEHGTTFTYYIKDDYKSLAKRRRDAEKEKQKKGEDVDMPGIDSLRKELDEQTPYLLFTIMDDQGNIIRRLNKDVNKGMNRITWDFRYPPSESISLNVAENTIPWSDDSRGFMVPPGTYKVSLSRFDGEKFKELAGPVSFKTVALNNKTISFTDRASLDVFNKKLAEMVRAVNGAQSYKNDLQSRLPYYKKAVLETPSMPVNSYQQVLALEQKLKQVNIKLNGDDLRNRYESVGPTSLRSRINSISGSMWNTTLGPSNTQQQSFNKVSSLFADILKDLKSAGDDAETFEQQMEKFGAPYTPGRLPVWRN